MKILRIMFILIGVYFLILFNGIEVKAEEYENKLDVTGQAVVSPDGELHVINCSYAQSFYSKLWVDKYDSNFNFIGRYSLFESHSYLSGFVDYWSINDVISTNMNRSRLLVTKSLTSIEPYAGDSYEVYYDVFCLDYNFETKEYNFVSTVLSKHNYDGYPSFLSAIDKNIYVLVSSVYSWQYYLLDTLSLSATLASTKPTPVPRTYINYNNNSYIIYTDRSGTMGYKYVYVSTNGVYVIQNTAPELVITTPVQVFYKNNNDNIVIIGTVYDADGNSINIQSTIDGKLVNLAVPSGSTWGLLWDISTLPINEGAYSNIDVYANDNSGGITKVVYLGTFIVDKTAPGIPIIKYGF